MMPLQTEQCQVIAMIRQHESELRRLGVSRISIFDGVACGNDRLARGVGVLVEFGHEHKLGRHASKFRAVADFLEKLHERKINLATLHMFNDRVREQLVEHVVIFASEPEQRTYEENAENGGGK